MDFTVTFDEDPAAGESLAADEITVSPPSPVNDLAGSGTTYTFGLDGLLHDTYRVTVNNGAVLNDNGEPNARESVTVIVDLESPKVVPPLETNIPIGSTTFVGATCVDDRDTAPNLSSTGTVNLVMEGSYDVTYTCTDDVGNSSTETVTF